MAYTATDLSNVCTAIILLATREATEVEIDGRIVIYKRSDLPYLRQVKKDIENEIAIDGSTTGSMSLVSPGGRN